MGFPAFDMFVQKRPDSTIVWALVLEHNGTITARFSNSKEELNGGRYISLDAMRRMMEGAGYIEILDAKLGGIIPPDWEPPPSES